MRWLSVDPYGEFASPYLAMGNNPAAVDPDGGCTICTEMGLFFKKLFTGGRIAGSAAAGNQIVVQGAKSGLGIGGALKVAGSGVSVAVAINSTMSGLKNASQMVPPFDFSKLSPVAIMVGGDADGYLGGGGEISSGGILVMRGPDAGRFVTYLDYGVGGGLDLSIGVEAGVIFYTGNVANFTIDNLRGERTEISGALLTWGANIFWSPENKVDGGRVIGVLGSYGPGINPLNLFGIPVPTTININQGATDLFQKK